MNWPNFSTTIDLYLAGAIYTVSVFVTVIWLRRTLTRNEQRIKATEGQIAARILLIVLSLLIPCYLIDLAFWSVVGLILAILILGLGIGGEPGGVIAMPFVLGRYSSGSSCWVSGFGSGTGTDASNRKTGD